MARKKRESGGGPGSGDWLNTYADMVTLLLTFFILLFSMSSLDAAKFNMIVTAFASDGSSDDKIVIRGESQGDTRSGSTALNSDGEPQEEIDLEDVYRAIQQMIESQNMENQVQASKGEGFVFIRFADGMLFEPNSAILKPQDKAILDFVGIAIKSVQSEADSISIVGHTAAIPGDPNYAVSDRILSTERANAVLMHFEDGIGIDPEKLFATGYGKWKPIAENDTPEGQSKNRRVEIYISAEGKSLSQQLDNAYEKLIE